MSPNPNRPAAAFRFAEEAIRAVAAAAVPGVASSLLFRIKNAATYHERNDVSSAQRRFVEQQELLLATFVTRLHEAIEADIEAGDRVAAVEPATTDWQSLGLVDEDRIEESILHQRIGQLISHASEPELRELDGYAGAVLGLGWADAARNPLRGDVIGQGLGKAIERITDDATAQRIIGRELGQAMADAMPACYREIKADLQKRQWKPVDVSLRPADEFSAKRPGAGAGGKSERGFDELRKAWEASWVGRPPTVLPDALRDWEASILGRLPGAPAGPDAQEVDSASSLLDRLMRGALPASLAPPTGLDGPSAAEQQLTELLRRMTAQAIERNAFERTQPDAGRGLPGDAGPDSARSWFGQLVQPPATDHTSLMAANLIRAHREELELASRGRVDHLVLEVVASLFDQILSDVRVAPQMARQIARLQLPVLRVALVDSRFFSSRRHPVRRFINRIASLGCAFDDFDSGAGASLLERVGVLVNEVVKGDFEQVDIYEAKLDALQRFVDDQAHAQVRASAAAGTLRDKEVEWRVQQRFAGGFGAALAPLSLPAFVVEFLCGVWAQAIVVASRRDGADAEYPTRLRRVAGELVQSLQQKRSIDERNRFTATLPALMSELTAGMAFVDWPPDEREAFFGKLISLHAKSLKPSQETELDHNMRRRQLDAAIRTPMPADAEPVEDGIAHIPASAADGAAAVSQHFSAEEQRAIGLLPESAVDWSSAVTIEPQANAASSRPAAAAAPVDAAAAGSIAGSAPGEAGPPSSAATDSSLPTIDTGALDAAPTTTDPTATAAARASARARASNGEALAGADLHAPPAVEPELAPGATLRDHLQLGFSYQMNLKGRWEKVRLTYMSPGRTLFLFAYGAKGRETVSMTTRTLGRLCEAGRLRAFETAFLIERSTARARQQLAALGRSAARPQAA